MSEYAPPTGPPPPQVPEGWQAVWNAQYNEWFYVNLITKASQWNKPTEPAKGPDAVPADAPPPSYAAGTTEPPASDVKKPLESNNPYNSNQTPGATQETDEEMARRLQNQERSGYQGSPAPGQQQGPPPGQYGQVPYGQNSYDQASYGPGQYGQGQYGQGQYGQDPYGQGQYGQGQYGQGQYGQPPYGQGSYDQNQMPPQSADRSSKSGGLLSKLKGMASGRPSSGGYPRPGYGSHGGYPQQHMYGGRPGMMGGGMMGGRPGRKPGMGAGGAAALGVGGGLLGGAMLASAINDGEQDAYQDGYQDGMGDDGGDFGGGDFDGGE